MLDQDNLKLAIFFVIVVAVVAFWLLNGARLRHASSWPTEAGQVESTAVVLKSGAGQPGAAA